MIAANTREPKKANLRRDQLRAYSAGTNIEMNPHRQQLHREGTLDGGAQRACVIIVRAVGRQKAAVGGARHRDEQEKETEAVDDNHRQRQKKPEVEKEEVDRHPYQNSDRNEQPHGGPPGRRVNTALLGRNKGNLPRSADRKDIRGHAECYDAK